jgi:AraC-like DNA-binding protein
MGRKYDDKFIDLVLDFLEENPHFNLNQLAQHFNVEPFILKSILKHHRGFVFTYWKWQKAYDLYKTGLKLQQISDILGYSNSQHISHIIKKHCDRVGLDYEKELRTKKRKTKYKSKQYFKKLVKKCNFSFKCIYKKTGLNYYYAKEKLEDFNLLTWFYENAIKLYPEKYTDGERTKMAIRKKTKIIKIFLCSKNAYLGT